MKKFIKSLICWIMALVIVISGAVPAFAKSSVTPVVVVHGMGGSALYRNPGDENEEALEGFDTSSLLGSDGLLFKLLDVAQGKDVDANEIIDALTDFMKPYRDIQCDENGNSINNIGINNYWTDSLANHKGYLDSRTANEPAICKQICDRIGAKNVYAFNYDWRLDACENAEKLNSFIDNVKTKTGKSKVTIVAGSEGTVVAAAYVDAYKSKDDIKRVVFLNGALNGVNVTKAFKQDVVFDKDVVMTYLENICTTYNSKEYDLSSLKSIVGALSGTVDNLCKYLNKIVDDPTLLNKVYNETLYPLGTIPALWEFIPYKDFDACISKMSSIGFLDKSSGLYSKISNYHKVQGRLSSNLKELKNKGVEIAVVANYGTPAIPVTSAYAEQTDILIDTDLASIGATVADFSKTLNRKGKYVSEDKVIDASTCLLPDSTWFIKGVQHMNFWYDTETTDFVAVLATTNSKLNTASIEKETGTGQFFAADSNQNIVSVTDNSNETAKKSAKTDSSDKNTAKKSPPTGNYYSTETLLIVFSAVMSMLIFAVIRKRKA